MPFIIKNGKYYGSGGGSGDSSIDITQAEYDKLEASGKVNHDVTYYITDGVYEEGEGNTNIVKLTQAQYDALGDEKLSDNNIYLITDADELTAKNLAYDDSETGLGVNNVQDAIVEQNKNITPVLVEGIEYYDSTYLISSAGKISATPKEIKFNMSCSINVIPDATNIFSITAGYFGWLNITEPSTGKTYLLHSNATGIISAWGAIPSIVNGVITGTLFKL